jgi:serine/threonine protein kinase
MTLNQPTPTDARDRNTTKRAKVVKVKPDPLQGRLVLGRYRVNSRLARGGMSSVYLARDVQKGVITAVKVLRQDLVLEQSARKRFLNECHAIQRIEHPAVVKILDVGETEDGRICLVMEYVYGSSLRKLLSRGPLKLDNAVPIIGAVAEGLAAAHEQCVIHRDLKPENVLIPRKKSSCNSLAKIVDFGIARIIDAPRITTTQHVMGTPQYISPEQAMGKSVDHRSDIYTLGVMMYEMLSGELPFSGDDPDFLLRQHVHAPPPPLTESATESEIPEDLKALVMRCLAKAPHNRPGSVEEFLSILAKISV